MIANQIRGTKCQLMKEEDAVLTMKLHNNEQAKQAETKQKMLTNCLP